MVVPGVIRAHAWGQVLFQLEYKHSVARRGQS
jgi:hypothetical protein